MQSSVYFGWGLIVPACLSMPYGFLAHHAIGSLGYTQKNTVWERIWNILLPLLLFTLWGIVNIPLPLFYLLAYCGKLSLLLRKNMSLSKELFLINFTHLTTMAMHMILIGALSLMTEIPMNEGLQQPFWRIGTGSVVLAINMLIVWQIPRWDMVLEVLRTQSDSAEIQPFMLFLWFCNLFLLLDSVLCISSIKWKLLSLFLIASTVLLEFYLIRFLSHIYLILKTHYLEEEYLKLTERLGQQNLNAEQLRSKIMLDPLTGVFSRRYLIEQAEYFLREKVPFSLVFIDLDHLKQVNDKEGHHAGDLYLIRFTKEFSIYLRKADIFARMGGDEFVVMLPGCPQETAGKRMEMLRSRLTESDGPPISFSYGVTSALEDSGDSMEEILRRADKEMYKDKQVRTGAEGGK